MIVLFALEIQGALTGGNAAARRSVREMLAGRVAVYFYGGTLLIGLVVPLALVSGYTRAARALACWRRSVCSPRWATSS